MQFHTIVSAFYLDNDTTDDNLDALLPRVGVPNVSPLEHRLALGFFDPAREVLGGQWGVFGGTWAVLDEVEGLICLQLYSSFRQFIRNQDKEMDYVSTFADACQSLDPIAALLDARAHYEIKQWEEQEGNRDWVLAQAKRIAAGDVNALGDERVSLLYLSKPMLPRWESNPSRDDRDMMELPIGRLFFAGRGPSRMA
jgi:hypothetical protein